MEYKQCFFFDKLIDKGFAFLLKVPSNKTWISPIPVFIIIILSTHTSNNVLLVILVLEISQEPAVHVLESERTQVSLASFQQLRYQTLKAGGDGEETWIIILSITNKDRGLSGGCYNSYIDIPASSLS